MTADLKPYPEYKDSGVPWLGKVPKHWDCLPHRVLFSEIKNQGHVDEPLLSVTISRGVIKQADLLTDTSKKDSSNLEKSKYKLVEPQDIAYNKMRAWQGAVGISRYRGIVSPAYIVVRLRRLHHPEYFHYLFRTPGFVKEAERWSYGITSDQWSLRPEHFKMIYSSVPPLSEQAAIVRFLDFTDRKIRRFLRTKRRMIALLREQKQAIINQAVTRGLDPNVPLKPSGIPWLGDIPEHWEVRRLKTLLKSIDQGVSPQAEAGLAENGAWGVLKSGCTNHGVFRQAEHKRLPEGYPFSERIVVREGDVLVSRACGTPRLVGSTARVGRLNYNLILSDKNFRLNFLKDVCVDFAVLAMIQRFGCRGIRIHDGLIGSVRVDDTECFRAEVVRLGVEEHL
ncbi:MAG: restriction endonuclease subunit S [Clostridiaceae bacterium]|nr:restriction endonuclease subunit S [Clostridiaceae bacterium]